METKYTITASQAAVIRHRTWHGGPLHPDRGAWIERLERGEGTLTDMRRAIAWLAANGRPDESAALAAMLPPIGTGYRVNPLGIGPIAHRVADASVAERLVNGEGTREDAETAERLYRQLMLTLQANSLRVQLSDPSSVGRMLGG